MGNDVFANGREISCKAGDGKSICAFPDVCFTPPENPATPPGVPIPYPNTGMAKDTAAGSKKVKISGKEIMLKNQSHFKKSMGDEAGSAAKKGVVTSVNRGKIYFTSWSMDVKFEGKNVVRHLDMTTHNHGSMPSNTGPWPYLDSQAMAPDNPCKDDFKKERDACEHLEVYEEKKINIKADRKTGVLEDKSTGGRLKKAETKAAQCADEECQKARKCRLVPYVRSGSPECCDGDQAHHLVEVHGFGFKRTSDSEIVKPFRPYDQNDAPCVCASGPKSGPGEHADLHSVQGALELGAMARAEPGHKNVAWTYSESREAGITAHKAVFPEQGCNEDCIRQQLDNYHKQEGMGIDDNTPLRTIDPGLKEATHQLGRGFELLTKMAQGVKKAGGLILGG